MSLTTQSLESIGFSVPTAARLRSEGIQTVADLIAREEAATVTFITGAMKQAPPAPKRQPDERRVSTLPVSQLIKGRFLNSRIETVSQLLATTPWTFSHQHGAGMKSLAQLIVCLVDEGYSRGDCEFFKEENVLQYLTDSLVYQEFMKLNAEGKLSAVFKKWFNKTTKGHLDSVPKRTNRKIFIKPFEV